MTEPVPPDPDWPRYSTRPFPVYRFLPGRTPHPRRSPDGHSYGLPEQKPSWFPVEEWQDSEDYLYGIDLYNFSYWWESHEVFEGFWHEAGHNTEQGNLFQALIQLGAAQLKHFMGTDKAAQNLLRRSAHRLSELPGFYLGINIADLRVRLRACLDANQVRPLLLKLVARNTDLTSWKGRRPASGRTQNR